MKNIDVKIDFENLNLLALEITKSYMQHNSDNNFSSPKEYTRSFAMFYARILAELEILKSDKSLTQDLLDKAMQIDFSKYED